MPPMIMQHDTDPKKDIWDNIGDLSSFELFNNQVLVAVYVRPEKTAGGIIIPGATRDEDKIQGKVGLVVKKGPEAFVGAEEWFGNTTLEIGDWVVFRPSDGWSITINGGNKEKVLCRILDDVNIRGRVQHPDHVW